MNIFAGDREKFDLSLMSGAHMMANDRTTTTRIKVHFVHSFMLPGFDVPNPPGTFDVEIDNEQIDSANSIAHRHVATFIFITGGSGARMVSVEPAELQAALERDRQMTSSFHGES